jgi:hypothetical protein
MADSSGIQELVDAAEHAASVGDWPSAEERLRRVADAQTAQLGPGHTDLAYTLNNLGVVLERVGKPGEAEQFYGRAYAIAAAALPSNDPLVVTSGQNFRELSASRGRPLDVPPSAPSPTPSIEAPITVEPPSSATADVTSRSDVTSHSDVTSLSSAIRIAVIVGVAFAALIGWYFWSGSGDSVDSVESQEVAEPQEVVETEAQSSPTPAVAPVPAAELPNITESRPAVPSKSPAASAPVTVVEAQLCSGLSTTDWRCSPASLPTAPGSLYFYTRLQSPSPATVNHRWYYEERLVQTVSLNISANQGPGYRTYSRQTISAERAGNWRVELRSQDGKVLHEERFVINR